MEFENTDKISTLFGEISSIQIQQNPSSSSNNGESQNSPKLKESTIDERDFHLKLKKLLNVPKDFSFLNVNIVTNVFVKEVQRFLNWVINKNGMTKENALNIKNQIQEKLDGIGRIEFDSIFVGVPGINVSEFFKYIKQYSFPNSEVNPIKDNENYTVIVESTHYLNTVIRKKKEQMRRYHLFFSLLDQHFKEDDLYLREFKNFFFQKFFLNPNFDLDELQLNLKKENINFPFSKNFIILIVTDHSFKLFEETIQKINNSHSSKFIKKSEQKCFPNLMEKEKKNYEKENNINERINISKEKGEINKRQENYDQFRAIIEEINQTENWCAKIIFFDMYFDLVVPKCVIEQRLNNIDKNINSKFCALQKSLSDHQKSLCDYQKSLSDYQKSLCDFQQQNQMLGKKMNNMIKFFAKKFHDENIISEFDEFEKNQKPLEKKENAEQK